LFALALRHDDKGVLDEAAVDYDVFATLVSGQTSETDEAIDAESDTGEFVGVACLKIVLWLKFATFPILANP
jgi:hypothetical protein